MSERHPESPALRQQWRDWWQRLPEPVRAPAWQLGFAVLVIVALLLGFHHVVRQSVRQGEVLRMSVSTHAEAVWRCQALSSPRSREQCLHQLQAPPAQPGRTPPNTAPLRVVRLGS
ncbi:hypothetical protein [Piscinibacter sp. XHJ-5]|uniref:hypothetical protein n=1 Tax=Piscinibacter sp. XHJ-5 TaxID=3037797 RepID=UPI002452D03A|nr:hypothetical protein [Piscinibacter sp. XHJ-5]